MLTLLSKIRYSNLLIIHYIIVPAPLVAILSVYIVNEKPFCPFKLTLYRGLFKISMKKKKEKVTIGGSARFSQGEPVEIMSKNCSNSISRGLSPFSHF